MSARLCESCKRVWPPNPDYDVCPFCQVKTKPRADKASMRSDLAEKLVAELNDGLTAFRHDWATAEEVAAAHGLDVYELLVSKRPPQEAA